MFNTINLEIKLSNQQLYKSSLYCLKMDKTNLTLQQCELMIDARKLWALVHR